MRDICGIVSEKIWDICDKKAENQLELYFLCDIIQKDRKNSVIKKEKERVKNAENQSVLYVAFRVDALINLSCKHRSGKFYESHKVY